MVYMQLVEQQPTSRTRARQSEESGCKSNN